MDAFTWRDDGEARLRACAESLVPDRAGEREAIELELGELVLGRRCDAHLHAEHRGTDPHADESRFRDRGVYDAFVAPLFPEAFGDFVGAVVLRDLFAHEDDVRVSSEFFIKAFAEGFTVGENAGHGKLRNGDGENGGSMKLNH